MKTPAPVVLEGVAEDAVDRKNIICTLKPAESIHLFSTVLLT